MSGFKTIQDVLDFAINAEQRAVDFYTELAEKAENASIRQAFLDFANEERGHKAKLEKFKATGETSISDKAVMDLKISDYTVEMQATPNMSFEDVLILAMKREKAAYRLYTNLAYLATSPEIQKVFKALAQEEAKHKLRFEIEYDDKVLREN